MILSESYKTRPVKQTSFGNKRVRVDFVDFISTLQILIVSDNLICTHTSVSFTRDLKLYTTKLRIYAIVQIGEMKFWLMKRFYDNTKDTLLLTCKTYKAMQIENYFWISATPASTFNRLNGAFRHIFVIIGI